MTYNVLMGTLNHTHSLSHSQSYIIRVTIRRWPYRRLNLQSTLAVLFYLILFYSQT